MNLIIVFYERWNQVVIYYHCVQDRQMSLSGNNIKKGTQVAYFVDKVFG